MSVSELQLRISRAILARQDWQLAAEPGMFWLHAHAMHKGVLWRVTQPGRGYIGRTAHTMNQTQLLDESRDWPMPAWCHDPVGLRNRTFQLLERPYRSDKWSDK